MRFIVLVLLAFPSLGFCRGIGGGGHAGSWTPLLVLLMMIAAYLAWRGFIHLMVLIWKALVRSGLIK